MASRPGSPTPANYHGAIAVNHRQHLILSLIKECLSYVTDSPNIDAAANYLTNIFINDNSQSSKQEQTDKLIKLILYTCKPLHSGRYALTFQGAVSTFVDNEQYNDILAVLDMDDIDIYPELFNNIKLTESEVKQSVDRHNREYAAIHNFIQLSEQIEPPYSDQIITTCVVTPYTYGNRKLFNHCERKLCITQNSGLTIMGNTLETEYCFDLLELIGSLAERPGINPLNDQQFSEDTKKLLAEAYAIEIKMYARFLELNTLDD